VDTEHRPPRLWVRRFALITSLRPFTVVEGRDIKLHRGLNVVWGADLTEDDTNLLVGHSVGKTLFCRLIRYGLGEDKYTPDEVQQQIERALPEAYLGLEVVVLGKVWCVLRPLCREKSMGQGKKREVRPEYAAAVESLEALAARATETPALDLFEPERADRAPGQAAPASSFDRYRQALESISDESLPAGIEKGDRPFDWAALLQWFARDQEARYVDVMVLRSVRSRTATPLDHEHSDLLVRSALRLADADEARLSMKLRAKVQEIAAAKKENAKNREVSWAITQQMMLRHQGTRPRGPGDADSKQTLLTADVAIKAELAELEPQLKAAKVKFQEAQQSYDGAYDEWRPVEERAVSIEKQLEARADTNAGFDDELRDLAEVKRLLKRHGHEVCEYCGLVREVACEDRLADEDAIRRGTEARRTEARERRAERRQRLQESLGPLQVIRRALWATLEARIAARDEARDALNDLARRVSVLAAELKEVGEHLERVRAADEGRASGPIVDVASLEAERDALETQLAAAREARQEQIECVRSAFSRVVSEVLNGQFAGAVELQQGRLRFGLPKKGGEAVDSLTVLLVDLSTLVMTIEDDASLPGLLVHDSPREADMDAKVYRRLFNYAEKLTTSLGGVDAAPFQYIVTTTTAPPPEIQGTDRVVLKLWAHEDGGLLLRKRIGEG